MAFEVPLEADTVKDNLLVSLISGPILGGLMWILGDEAQQRDESWSELHRGMQDIVLDDIDDVDDLQPSNVKQKSLPHLVRSELTMDCAEEHSCNSQPDISFGIRNQEASSSDNFLGFNHRHRTEKKKMSWSDNLVEYMDDEVRKTAPKQGLLSSLHELHPAIIFNGHPMRLQRFLAVLLFAELPVRNIFASFSLPLIWFTVACMKGVAVLWSAAWTLTAMVGRSFCSRLLWRASLLSLRDSTPAGGKH